MRFQVPVLIPGQAEHAYTVHIGQGLLSQAGPLIAQALKRQAHRAFVVADARVPASQVIALGESLKSIGLTVRSWAFRPSEQDKSLTSLERILVEMAKFKLERNDPVIALGGGVTGDLAGFAAAIYRRGVPMIQCPTTLLSMVDAAVGGKTAVNLAMGEGSLADLKKNLIGAFHQPSLVLADVSTLTTLPPRTLHSGLAECIKHGMLGAHGGDPGLFPWLESSLDRIMAYDLAALAELVSRNVAIKAHVVRGDEREEAQDEVGGRALLNLGHTFGHAIETISHLTPDGQLKNAPLQHGEAVALGLVAACATSQAMGLCDGAFVARIRELVRRAGLPVAVAGLPAPEEFLGRMMHDKKVIGGRLRLILPQPIPTASSTMSMPKASSKAVGTPSTPQPGYASVVNNPPIEVVEAGIAAIGLQDGAFRKD